MTKIKAILCDFDGTLVDKNKKYFPGTKNLIDKIMKKGVRFSLATGRAYYEPIQKVEEELNIKGPHILHGGSMIYDSKKDKIYWYQPIPKESVLKIAGYLLKQKIIFALETKKYAYISSLVETTDYIKDSNLKEYKYFDGKYDVLKMVVFARINKFSEKKMDIHIKAIKKLSSEIEIIKYDFLGNFGVDITSIKASKHSAVLEYCKIFNLNQKNVVAIGDSYNDYPLFTASGFKIAMGDAHKELKEVADLIVSSVEEGGISQALTYILDNLI